ncbi:hypothetical protein A4G99_13560 [Haladaptatus sp. R4]|uniref:GNAT family N-acetyltransferase n=1 Tax=Haladaptatus sp. R4 TaxID=1679489 RepID=UPI0007B47535|nr:N-acetyltransferase [Haladaptatus sp. R4]KZN23864.1 hypothetical protein A4G99_13560 [Haladaptatus sp. R4]
MNDFSVRQEQATEIDEISDVVAAAFGRRDEADIVAALRESSEFRPALSLVAHRDDEIVGHVMFTDATLDDDEERGALVLAPLAVAPDHQRSGVGSRLVRIGLDAPGRRVTTSSFSTEIRTTTDGSDSRRPSPPGSRIRSTRPTKRFRCSTWRAMGRMKPRGLPRMKP